MKTTNEILAESKRLRSGMKQDSVAETLPRTNVQPLPWHYYFGQVLGAVGFSWCDMVWNTYLGEYDLQRLYDMDLGVTHKTTIIVHGHNRDKFCAESTLCHVLGYKPSGELTPTLMKEWKKFGYED